MPGSSAPKSSQPLPGQPAERVKRFLWTHAPFAALLVLAGVLYASTLNAYGMLMWDEAEYASIGRSVLRGEGFAIDGRPNPLRPPVVPLGVTASMWVSGRGTDTVAKCSTLAFALLALTVVYVCATTAYDRFTGLVAAALLGIAPWFWTATPRVLSEIPFLAFFAGAVWCLEFALYRDGRYFVRCGVCAALALLTRYTGMLFGPVAVAMVVVALATGGAAVRRRVLSLQLLAGMLSGAVVLGPWFVRQQLTFGDALIGVKISSTQLQVYMPHLSMPWSVYLTNLPHMLSPVTVGLLAAGTAWALWQRDRFALYSVAVAVGILVWFSSYRYKEARMVSSALPFLCVVAAVPLTRVPSPRARLAVAVAVVLGTFAWNYTRTQPVFEGVITNGYPPLLRALQYAKAHSDRDAILVGASVPQMVWYADRRVRDFPEEAEFPRLLTEARWVLVTNFEPGQKPYARGLAKKVTADDVRSQRAVVFTGYRFSVLLIDAALLRERL